MLELFANRWTDATRRMLAAGGAAVLLAAAACSSPTAPSTPPVSTPPPTPPTTTPPSTTSVLAISCPANVTTTATSSPTAVTFSAPTTSGGVAPVQTSCTRASGSLFASGATQVQCTATDAATAAASCAFTVTVNVTPPRLSRTRFLAFGDSVTAGEVTVPSSTSAGQNFKLIIVPSASYPTQLLQMLRARYTDQVSQLQVVNNGLPGEWAQDGALRLPGVMSNARPEAVLLLEGYNDLGASGTNGINAAWSAIDRMAKEVRGRGARLFLSTLPPPGPLGAKSIPASQVIALNDRIRTTAAGEGAVLVDAYAALVVDVPRYIGADGLHLTEAGYLKLADLFFTAIRNDLEVR